MPMWSLKVISSIINAAALCLIIFSSSVHELKRRDDGQRRELEERSIKLYFWALVTTVVKLMGCHHFHVASVLSHDNNSGGWNVTKTQVFTFLWFSRFHKKVFITKFKKKPVQSIFVVLGGKRDINNNNISYSFSSSMQRELKGFFS